MSDSRDTTAPPPVPGTMRFPPSAADFSRREFALPELLDEPCTYATWRAASLDLARLNRFTRGYKPTLAFLDRAVACTGVGYGPLHVVDVGCGHGDGLRTIYRWARKRSLPLRLTGIDLNPYAARLARERDRAEFLPAGAISWVTGDVFAWQPEPAADLVISSLFAHHLSDRDIVRFLRWCEAHAHVGWFTSDLIRSARAAKVIRWLTFLLGLHPILQHDAPVSFRRALRADDWERLLQEGGLSSASVQSAGGARLALGHLRPRPH